MPSRPTRRLHTGEQSFQQLAATSFDPVYTLKIELVYQLRPMHLRTCALDPLLDSLQSLDAVSELILPTNERILSRPVPCVLDRIEGFPDMPSRDGEPAWLRAKDLQGLLDALVERQELIGLPRHLCPLIGTTDAGLPATSPVMCAAQRSSAMRCSSAYS